MSREKYNKLIKKLMKNDSNCSLDTLLEECENDFEYACYILRSVVDRILDEEPKNEFYKKILIEGWM